MMDCTDRHFRYLMRLVTRRTLLYTEMITTSAILRGPRMRLLEFDPIEHPLSLQLGGDDPAALAECARIAVEEFGYDEVNLNCGCPSDRVQGGGFGACLMARPDQVARCVEAMRGTIDAPVTVKHRIGIDNDDTYEFMSNFVTTVASAGCERFTVHARKAWLTGLSPKENRTIPPLRYELVHRLKREHSRLGVEINGGFIDLEVAREQLEHVDAVMIGRRAYDAPYSFAAADALFFGDDRAPLTRVEVVHAFLPHVEEMLRRGHRLHAVVRHALGLFSGVPGTKAWKRALGSAATRPGAGPEALLQALDAAQGGS